MARPFLIKRNDTSRSLKFYPKASPASNFTGATAVFNMRERKGSTKVSRASATISSDSGGTYFQFDWSASDTDTAGDFEAEFEVTLANSAVETYPNSTWIDVKVTEDIA